MYSLLSVIIVALGSSVVTGLAFWFYKNKQIQKLIEERDDKEMIIASLQGHIKTQSEKTNSRRNNNKPRKTTGKKRSPNTKTTTVKKTTTKKQNTTSSK